MGQRPTKKQIAFHAAGPAVVALSVDWKVEQVSMDCRETVIVPDDLSPASGEIIDPECWPAVIALAGPMAEARSRLGAGDDAPVEDMPAGSTTDNVLGWRSSTHGLGLTVDEMLQYWQWLAQDHLSRVWPAVEALAGALVVRGCLSGAEVEGVVAEAMGQAGDEAPGAEGPWSVRQMQRTTSPTGDGTEAGPPAE